MWTFAIKQKMTAAALLFAVTVLVILTNLREQRSTERISASVTSLYEDRLVVAQYILQLSKQIDGIIATLEKEEDEITTKINNYLIKIKDLNALYEKTTLTEVEKINFERFKELCQAITLNNRNGNHSSVLQTATEAGDTLQTLSNIQVEEGKNKLDE
ncbi:MAG: MCP four helix bundle domain-containing protein, partial [Sphingobacterium sp.]